MDRYTTVTNKPAVSCPNQTYYRTYIDNVMVCVTVVQTRRVIRLVVRWLNAKFMGIVQLGSTSIKITYL